MTSLDVIAHQPRLTEQQFLPLHHRVLAMLRHARAVAMRPIPTRVAAVVTGVMTPIALYLAFIGLPATASVCVGTIPV